MAALLQVPLRCILSESMTFHAAIAPFLAVFAHAVCLRQRERWLSFHLAAPSPQLYGTACPAQERRPAHNPLAQTRNLCVAWLSY